ncbi:MAG: sugar nucleotide-binding protein, partial [Terriglobales bacterium]
LRSGAPALVARVAHLFGGSSRPPGRANLAARFLQQARAGEPILVTRGQVLNPTLVADIVPACLTLLERGATGLFHLTGEGSCSAEQFARAVLEFAQLRTEIRVVARDSRPAPRARMTVLENRRWAALGLPPLPTWRASLARSISAL